MPGANSVDPSVSIDLYDLRNNQKPVARPSAGASKHVTSIGNGSSTSITVTHNLGTRWVLVRVYDNSSPYEEIACTVRVTSTNTCTLIFGVAPATDEYTAVVVG